MSGVVCDEEEGICKVYYFQTKNNKVFSGFLEIPIEDLQGELRSYPERALTDILKNSKFNIE